MITIVKWNFLIPYKVKVSLNIITTVVVYNLICISLDKCSVQVCALLYMTAGQGGISVYNNLGNKVFVNPLLTTGIAAYVLDKVHIF